MEKLDDHQLHQALVPLPGWLLESGTLVQHWTFRDFNTAMNFVNQVAALAESAGHHPDIDIRYNRVTLALVTHDAGGITQKDIELASKISSLHAPEKR